MFTLGPGSFAWISLDWPWKPKHKKISAVIFQRLQWIRACFLTLEKVEISSLTSWILLSYPRGTRLDALSKISIQPEREASGRIGQIGNKETLTGPRACQSGLLTILGTRLVGVPWDFSEGIVSPNSTFASSQRAIKNNLLAVKFLFFSPQLQILSLLTSSGKQEPIKNKKTRPLLVVHVSFQK